jgi:hypothetical protein
VKRPYEPPRLRGPFPLGGTLESMQHIALLPDLLNATHDEIVAILRSCGIAPDAPWLVGKCPACGGAYVLGVNAGQPTTSRLLFHSDPACERSIKLPALGFLQWARTEGGPSLQRRGGELAKLPKLPT